MNKLEKLPKCKDDPFQAIHRMAEKINEIVEAINALQSFRDDFPRPKDYCVKKVFDHKNLRLGSKK